MTPRVGATPAAPLALAAMLALASCGPRDVQAPDALLGRWQGHVAWRDATTPLELEVVRDGDSLAARLRAPALRVESIAAGRLAFDSPRVHFAVRDSGGTIEFNGWLRRGLLVGAFSAGPLGAERNRSLLPQLSFRQLAPRTHPLPWPDSLSAPAPLVPEPQRSLGAWLAAHGRRR